MKIRLFSVNVFIEVEFPVDLGSSCGHCLINEEVKGHMCSKGSSRIIYKKDRLKNRSPEVRVEASPEDPRMRCDEESYNDLSHARGLHLAGMYPAPEG